MAAVIAWRTRAAPARLRLAAFAMAVLIAGAAAWQISAHVSDARTGEGAERRRVMMHGGVEHGSQYLEPARRSEPLAYCSPGSGVALAISRVRELAAGRPMSAGFIGLGAGALAAYGQEGDRFRFYEINPQVIDLARSEFTYLSDSKADVSLALGDARFAMEREAPELFDIIVVDAFSGDAISLHLLTREAMAIYRRRLREDGAILFHISNRFVDLQPALARLAAEENLHARIITHSPDESEDGESPLLDSDWVLMSASQSWFASPQLSAQAEPLAEPMAGRAWTDDFNNILSAIRLGGSEY